MSENYEYTCIGFAIFFLLVYVTNLSINRTRMIALSQDMLYSKMDVEISGCCRHDSSMLNREDQKFPSPLITWLPKPITARRSHVDPLPGSDDGLTQRTPQQSSVRREAYRKLAGHHNSDRDGKKPVVLNGDLRGGYT